MSTFDANDLCSPFWEFVGVWKSVSGLSLQEGALLGMLLLRVRSSSRLVGLVAELGTSLNICKIKMAVVQTLLNCYLGEFTKSKDHFWPHNNPFVWLHSYPFMMFYENLYHNVLKLDIHDGGHCLLLWPEQSWSEDHAQVGDCHQIVLVVTGHPVGDGNDVWANIFKVLRQHWIK